MDSGSRDVPSRQSPTLRSSSSSVGGRWGEPGGSRRRVRNTSPSACTSDATGDQQWIHVDPVRAAQGPYGRTIAHGYLTLSLLPLLSGEAYQVDGLKMTINYGLDRVRFPAPVPVGSRVRNRPVLVSLTPSAAGTKALVRHTLELEGSERPACVAEQIRLMVV